MHAGQSRDLSVLRQEDQSGAGWHSFTGGDAYVWNNKEGDSPALYEVAIKQTIDSASYDPNPPEGLVLNRIGAKLVAVPVSVGGFRR